MNASLSLSGITTPISRFFSKYHATIFFTTIILLLAGAIFILYMTLQGPADVDTSEEVISSSFDEQTADQIKQLRESNESSRSLTFPSPRSNPFVE